VTNATQTPNRLINENSPYLLQHAHNPVDWYPWGNEAFEKAKAEDKPVFLSIGYSTCHWCHVMEQESFEDQEVAAFLNKSFISIKVDKEERPDIDSVYMDVCQAITGSGGWPLTVVMTPEQKPFFAGTYFPKRRRYGQIGLIELLETIRQKWEKERESLLASGDQIAAAFAHVHSAAASFPDGKEVVTAAYQQLTDSFDTRYGGFGGAPKFPMPHQLMFLLRCHHLGMGGNALMMVESTLSAMYKGGIYDHIGGGFSRYSTDDRWFAPHFEKMLYDNALLVIALLECHQITGKGLYKRIVAHTMDYIRREMTAPEGGFYSAQDADSEGEEGKFYTFTHAEILDVLGTEAGWVFCRLYGVTEQGNFEGRNILNLLHHQAAAPPDDEGTGEHLEKLLQYRSNRHRLHKDDKILTSWNALMIAACAKAGRVLDQPAYLDMATGAFQFIRQNLAEEGGRLLVSHREGKSKGTGLLDDYAFLAWACLELYASTFDVSYLQHACSLMKQVLTRFSREEGGFYLSPTDGEALIFRPVEQQDGAVPSGNSVAAWCLSRLAALTGEALFQEAAEKQLNAYGAFFQNHPTSCTFALMALLQVSAPTQELLCALPDEADGKRLVQTWGRAFQPQTGILVKTPDNMEALAKLAPFTDAYPIGGRPAYYLCSNRSCSAPVDRIEDVLQMLR